MCIGVSIHAPAWGATSMEPILVRFFRFNPRARMGRDWGADGSWLLRDVSIHAPAWGATRQIL